MSYAVKVSLAKLTLLNLHDHCWCCHDTTPEAAHQARLKPWQQQSHVQDLCWLAEINDLYLITISLSQSTAVHSQMHAFIGSSEVSRILLHS